MEELSRTLLLLPMSFRDSLKLFFLVRPWKKATVAAMQGGDEEEEAFRHRLRRALSQSWPHKRNSLIPPTLLQSFYFFFGAPLTERRDPGPFESKSLVVTAPKLVKGWNRMNEKGGYVGRMRKVLSYTGSDISVMAAVEG